MQRHEFSFDIDATPDDVWQVFHGPKPRVIEHGDVRIEVLHPGADGGNGLVRHCHFRVPKYLLSGGRAKSWEWLTELDPPHRWRYDAIGKPLWSETTGVTELEDLGGGRTRVCTSPRPTTSSIPSCGDCSNAGCTASSRRTTTA